jgi:hypothetical protein
MKGTLHLLNHHCRKTLAVALATSSLALAGLAADDTGSASADTTNLGPAHADNSNQLATLLGRKDKKERGYWLPREVLDKLTPEQLIQLETAHNHVPGGGWALLVPLAPFAAGVLITGIIIWFNQRKNQTMHETLRAMIEKGAAIPPELINPPAREHKPQNDLRLGLIFVAIGVGATLCLLILGESAWGAGFVPLLIGAAFLMTWKIEANKSGRN